LPRHLLFFVLTPIKYRATQSECHAHSD
jgi:hypothetical protein